MATGEKIRTFAGHRSLIFSAAFSPDGSKVLTGSFDHNTVEMWNAATGKQFRTFRGHTWGSFLSVVFSPDGSKILAGSNDRTAKLWDAATGALLKTFSGHRADVHSVAFSPDGRKVPDRIERQYGQAMGRGHGNFDLHLLWPYRYNSFRGLLARREQGPDRIERQDGQALERGLRGR